MLFSYVVIYSKSTATQLCCNIIIYTDSVANNMFSWLNKNYVKHADDNENMKNYINLNKFSTYMVNHLHNLNNDTFNLCSS